MDELETFDWHLMIPMIIDVTTFTSAVKKFIVLLINAANLFLHHLKSLDLLFSPILSVPRSS